MKLCPQLDALDLVAAADSFESGGGGYGYNSAYLGGPRPDFPKGPYRPTNSARLPQPARTVMFATTAMAVAKGLQEYPFTEAFQARSPGGALTFPLTPSTHFRFAGKALVAWCDGRVSAETPNADAWPGPNAYGANNREASIGWFGPQDANGYWNPWYPAVGP